MGVQPGSGRFISCPTSSLTVCILCLLSPVLKNVEDDHLNDSLGNPGLISPDKEDLSRLLVRQEPPLSFFYLRCTLVFSPQGCA